MPSERYGAYRLFGMALLAALLFCWGWRTALGFRGDPFWLLKDRHALLMLIFFYPIIEELSFRGVIQGALLRWTRHRELFPGITMANGITSLLFVLAHCVHHSPMWAVAVLIPSLIFGYFRDCFGSVVPPIFLHAFYNLIFYAAVGK